MMLRLKNIYKTYEQGRMDVPVLKDITMDIDKGEYVAIMGPSGSGKTTLMNIIGCLDIPSSGSYYLDGQNILEHTEGSLSDIRLKSIGFVFQSFYLLPRQTALENVALPLLYAGIKKKQRIEIAKQALARVGLGDRFDFRPTQLSGGQCQRVAIARAIVNQPKILLADEPTGALDTASGKQIMDIFQSLNNEGVTVVMITHEKEIADHAKRVFHIRDGMLVDPSGIALPSSSGSVSPPSVRPHASIPGITSKSVNQPNSKIPEALQQLHPEFSDPKNASVPTPEKRTNATSSANTNKDADSSSNRKYFLQDPKKQSKSASSIGRVSTQERLEQSMRFNKLQKSAPDIQHQKPDRPSSQKAATQPVQNLQRDASASSSISTTRTAVSKAEGSFTPTAPTVGSINSNKRTPSSMPQQPAGLQADRTEHRNRTQPSTAIKPEPEAKSSRKNEPSSRTPSAARTVQESRIPHDQERLSTAPALSSVRSGGKSKGRHYHKKTKQKGLFAFLSRSSSGSSAKTSSKAKYSDTRQLQEEVRSMYRPNDFTIDEPQPPRQGARYKGVYE